VTGFVAPALGATPQAFGALTPGSGQYTVSGLTWSPSNNPFLASTVYTATVVLTSAATYKFPTGGIAVPTSNLGTASAGTTSGGDVSGNTLTFTVLFPATADVITGGGSGASREPAIIYVPSISIQTPAAGTVYNNGSTIGLDWTPVNGAFTKYKVSYSIDNGVSWTMITDNATSTALSWIVPNSSTVLGRVKIEGYASNGDLLASAVSNGVFTIVGATAIVPPVVPPGTVTPPAVDSTATGLYAPAAAIINTPDINTDKGLSTGSSQPTTAHCTSGTLIKGSFSTVYFCGADGKRYVFVNDRDFMSWYENFSGVQIISDANLAQIPLGGNVTYRPGKKMIKIQSDPRVYAVSRGGVLRWVSTESIARQLFGADWNKQIDDVSDAFFINYRIGDPITQ